MTGTTLTKSHRSQREHVGQLDASGVRPQRRSGRARLRRLLTVHLPLLALCGLWLLPTAGLLVSSFRTQLDASSTGWWQAFTPPLRFTEWNYREVLTEGGVGRAFFNSLIITVPSVSVMISLGTVFSYTLARMRFRGGRALFGLMLVLSVIPIQMALLPVLRFYNGTGLSGTWPGIWLAHAGMALPFVTYLLHTFFRDLPGEIFEAAEIDGANHASAFQSIALPLAAPAIATAAIFQFLWVWNDLLVSLVLLGGNAEVAPLTVVLSGQVNQTTGQDWNLLTAAAFISMICPLVVFFALQRYFVRGLVAGSVK